MATRDDLDTAYAKALARHAGQLRDTGGRPGPALLADLAAIAERHADDILHEENGVTGIPSGPALQLPVSDRIPAPTPAAQAARPARRTPARRTAKE